MLFYKANEMVYSLNTCLWNSQTCCCIPSKMQTPKGTFQNLESCAMMIGAKKCDSPFPNVFHETVGVYFFTIDKCTFKWQSVFWIEILIQLYADGSEWRCVIELYLHWSHLPELPEFAWTVCLVKITITENECFKKN